MAPLEAFLQMIWAVDALRSGRDQLAAKTLRFPPEAVGQGMIGEYAIHPWELETLTNQRFLAPNRNGSRQYKCEEFGTAADFVNKLRNLEDADTGVLGDRMNVFNELHRIGQRQFPWQRGGINLPDFYRPIYLYGQGECAARFEAAYKLSVSQFALFGFAVFATFSQRPYTEGPLDFEPLGLSRAEIDAALPLMALNSEAVGGALSKLIVQSGAGAWPTAYKPSILRGHPIIAFGHGRKRLRVPLPILALQRITFGLYYDLLTLGSDLRNEIAARFESYSADLIRAMAPRFAVRQEYEYRGPRKGSSFKSPDILVKDGDDLAIVIECKATKLTLAAQFSNDPAADAEQRYGEIGKGVYQLWRFFAHCRLGLTEDRTGDKTFALLLTLDTWLVMSRDLQTHVLDVAGALADADRDITEADRRPVLFCAIQDFEHLLSRADEDGMLATLSAANEERFLGWLLPNVDRELAKEKRLNKPYPFKPDVLLPWWPEAAK